MGFLTYDVSRYTPQQLVALPLVLFVVSLAILGYNVATTGMPVQPGIDFAGGTGVTIFTIDTRAQIESYFAGDPLNSVEGGISNGWYLTFDPMSTEARDALTDKVTARYPNPIVNNIEPTFASSLQVQALFALMLSFAGMAVVVFVAFRNFVPSFAVVTCAFADIVVTAAIMSLLGIPLNLGTTAALLMLIGYSVDSDILLTTRVLKRKGKLDEKLQGAYHTGIIMTSTTLAAVTAMWIVATVGQVQIIAEIAAVLIIGLAVDIVNTWLTNVGLLKWYMERRGAR
jgi:preprotein translocase subunit SecF